MGLFCEVIGVLQLDELDGAATKREGGGETQGVVLRELVRQPVEQAVPQGCCQAHGGHSELGAFPGGVCPPNPPPLHRKPTQPLVWPLGSRKILAHPGRELRAFGIFF